MTRRYEQANGTITHYAGACPGPTKITNVNIEDSDPDRYADCDDFGAWDDHTY